MGDCFIFTSKNTQKEAPRNSKPQNYAVFITQRIIRTKRAGSTPY